MYQKFRSFMDTHVVLTVAVLLLIGLAIMLSLSVPWGVALVGIVCMAAYCWLVIHDYREDME